MSDSLKRNSAAVLLMGGAFLTIIGNASAQSVSSKQANANQQTSDTASYVGMTEQDVGVMDRARPAYDAKGIPLGGFRLFPTLDLSESYDDNIFRQPDGDDDFFFKASPMLYLRSEWGRHFVELYAGSETYVYSQYTDENLTDWKYGADGRYDISRAATATVSTYYGEMHEAWQTPNTDTGYQAEPNRYFQTHSDLTTAYQPNRLGVGAGVSFDRYIYRFTPRIGGGYLSNSDRDQNHIQAYGEVFYDFSPGYKGFVKATYDERDFDDFYDRSDYHRSSHGYSIDSGLDLQITHLLSGEVFLGYRAQNYSQNVSNPLSDFSGLDYGANLNWYADQMLTVHLTASRTLSDVTVSGASGSDNKSVALSADYEVLRDLIWQADVKYTESKYVGMDRKYKYPGAGTALKWLMNRYMSLNISYDYSSRSANVSGAKFTDNIVSITLQSHI